MNSRKESQQEDRRWEAVIAQYKTEIGASMLEINSLCGKGYATRSGNSVVITERGIGFIEGKIESAGKKLKTIDIDADAKHIDYLMNESDTELDVMACSYIYKEKYKSRPNEKSLEILRRMLKTANIPKSE